eukprot:GEMP01009588.1.p1 GENE.GEMP01009588.1~~GEMP01009588.1.p1  ORF type:complete len:856 (+),score=172.38 GEMP01009588.1:69-2636(+)
MRECVHLHADKALGQLRSSRFQNALHESESTGSGSSSSTLRLGCHCGSSDVWVCLSENCLTTSCGRTHRQHALKHFEDTGHPVCIHLNSTMIWCYECDDEVVNEENAKLVEIRKAIKIADNVSVPTPNRRGVVGLTNLGNTCFMNSALQCLAHTPTLQRHFRKAQTRPDESTAPRKLIAGMTDWFAKDWKSSASSHMPNDILRSVQQLNPMFQGYAQHDAQEFLRCVLDSAHDTLKTDVPVNVQEYVRKRFGSGCLAEGVGADGIAGQGESGGGGSASSSSGVAKDDCEADGERLVARARVGQDSKSRNPDALEPWSIVRRTFGGRIVSNVKCLSCKEVSRTIDPTYDISVPIPNAETAGNGTRSANGDATGTMTNKGALNLVMQKVNTVTSSMRNWFVDRGVHISDCLHKFCETEILTGRDQYLCEKCKRKNDCEKSIRLLDLPEILCIHVKRFRYDGNSWFGTKNSKVVSFPLHGLDVREFLDPESEEKETAYRLIGVVQHMGSMGGGHYIAYCLHYKTKEWYEFDDTRVTLVSADTVEKAEPYILFYQKVPSKSLRLTRGTVKAEKRRLQNESRVDVISNGRCSIRDELAAKTDVCYISKEWYQRLQTTSHCGPIDNFLHLCPHSRLGVLDGLQFSRFIPISTTLYHQLVEQFGGGPMVTSIEKCEQCARYIRAYNARKATEYDLVNRYDSKSPGAGKCWYLVDATWVDKWKKYVDQGTEITDIREMIAPGKISADRLLESSGNPKPNLKLRADFIGVNSMVWAVFAHVHGVTSAPISREGLSIYSPIADPSTDPTPPELEGRFTISWQYVDYCKGDPEIYNNSFGHRHNEISVVSDDAEDLPDVKCSESED